MLRGKPGPSVASLKKRLFMFGVLLIFAAIAAAGSYMFDEDVSTDNNVSAAVFDLKVNGKDVPGPVFDSIVLAPGESITTEVPVRLIARTPGTLSIIFKNIENSKSSKEDPDLQEYSNSESLLSDFLYVSVNGGSRSTLKEGLSKTVGILEPGETTTVLIKIDAKTTMDNSVQGDRCKFDIAFRCEQ